MIQIDYFEIEFSNHHGQIMGSIQFDNMGTIERSNLYSINELNQILTHWKNGTLMGSFAIGTRLAKRYSFQIFQRG